MKKSGELRSTNNKVFLARIEPPKWIFWETIFQPLGVLRPEIYTRARDCKSIDSIKFVRAKKTSKIQRDFWQLSTLIANISGKTPDIQNLKQMWSTAIPPTFQEESPVNFGPQTKKIYWLELSHPSEFFGRDYISAPRGFCALKFIHALEIAQALIAHTRSGTGVSQKNFNRENLKFALKFSVLATIPGASGSIPTKHFPYDVPPGKGHNIGINFGRPAP